MILCCGLRDDLVERARAGDAEALRLLIAALPAHLPANVRKAARDERIRGMATWLAASLDDPSTHRIAGMIAAVGAQVQAGHQALHGEMFADLAGDEQVWLMTEVRAVLAWSPDKWPKRRQIISIIAE